MIINR